MMTTLESDADLKVLFSRIFDEVHRLTEADERTPESSAYAFSLGTLTALALPRNITLPEVSERVAQYRAENGHDNAMARAADFVLENAQDIMASGGRVHELGGSEARA